EVRNAVEADLAAGPRLDAGPFDALVEIARLARRKMIDVTRRAPAAARVDAHAGVAFRHPLLGVDDFPALVEVARARRDVGMFGRHALPRARVAVLERESLRVRAVSEDDRTLALAFRPIDIGPQNEPVVHLDWNVPIDFQRPSN